MTDKNIIPISLIDAYYEDDDAVNLHTCPYAEELYGDSTTLCDCSPEKTHECMMDI